MAKEHKKTLDSLPMIVHTVYCVKVFEEIKQTKNQTS